MAENSITPPTNPFQEIPSLSPTCPVLSDGGARYGNPIIIVKRKPRPPLRSCSPRPQTLLPFEKVIHKFAVTVRFDRR